MKCFVIMPFAEDFADVYAVIKFHVESAVAGDIKCSRLDEHNPAGRITDRLIIALRECSFCVADLTGCSPNVMWEMGYAMALGKPLIIVTQDRVSLPFDVKDMQALSYDRTRLQTSLGSPLRDVVRDTISITTLQPASAPGSIQEDQVRLVTGLGVQLSELKEMVGQVVQAWSDPGHSKGPTALLTEFRRLEGSWRNDSTDSNVYISSVAGRLVAPYCYGGENDLTAYYYGWQKLGDYFFARFKWLSREISGFTFLRLTSRDVLQGAWWYDHEVDEVPTNPLMGSGNPTVFRRLREGKPPSWAIGFVERVREGKIPEYE
jgi:nucleoside 2-deoxyribosyltransferase